jgi:lysophospholipase L1-like esterase
MKDYAAKHKAIYLDYFTPMLDEKGALKKELTDDGLHPNDAGYELIMPIAQKAIDRALK